MKKSIPRTVVLKQVHHLPTEILLRDADSAQTFARFQNDGPGACNLSVGAYPEVAQPHKATRSYPWGVSAIFENWESPELSVIAVAMAAFAVEPQAPTLGE